MKTFRHVLPVLLAGAAVLLAACSDRSAPAPAAEPAATSAPAPASIAPAATVAKATATPAAFTPPKESAIPDNEFGAMVRKGRDIFTNTHANATEYVGNQLNCSNCHLDAGRRANSAPLWAAYVRYPRYRAKNDQVNTFTERLQGCFQFSMNGKAPPADSEVIEALTTYAYWMATGAPTGVDLPGYGYPKQDFSPPRKPDFARGEKVYESHCAMCHGDDGHGQQVAGEVVFPALWGAESFNWGAGMHQLNNAAAFIKANMPFSRGGTLSDQQAWDVAMYMDSHERPQDPRFQGDVSGTRKKYHDSKWSLYGTEVNGHVLGSGTAGKTR